MASHVERMEAELAELNDKCEKLEHFIRTNPIFQSLDKTDQELLVAQHAAMDTYSIILGLRIERTK